MPGIASPTIFDEIPTKRPHFFFLMFGKRYFALKKWESKFVAMVFRHVARSRTSMERASYRPSLNLRAGSVWFGVTNEGVVRVKLNDVDQRKRGDAGRVEGMTPFRCRSTYCTPKLGSSSV